ncbi:lactosylceramide 1,3-N-acetyl-beta-D-glucosaminyltransferase A-like [Palaemon carinicauda]|uniref:lactosylceramide 1,3-N-acetyl-beta-D-glucosaminyltransferase A-like n=1 Tax=Palaemon carinicauda TaxID=392227 RepID=UPI0035B670CD
MKMIKSTRYVRNQIRDFVYFVYRLIMSTQRSLCWCCHPTSFALLFLTIIGFYVIVLCAGFLTNRPVHNPAPLSSSPLYPPASPLLDLKDFAYIINNDVCGRENVFATVIIHTHPANRERRDIMRKNIPSSDLYDLGVRRVFLLARAEWNDQDLYRRTPQEYINDENVLHKDIVQGNFKEHYHNLTYKHVMGLQWASRYCPTAKYIIKMDDDIVVDLYQFRDRLKTRYPEKRNLILGLLQVDSKPVRNKKSKWYVSETEFPADYYAPFMSGWAYAMTLDAARAIVEEAAKQPYFWIDDVHVTGTLAERVGVKREGLNRFYTIHVEHLKCCLDQEGSADYTCDYMVGPCEGDFAVFSRALAHGRSCYINPCMRRPPEIRISKTCVLAKATRPYAPLGKGQGEIVKVFKREN